jgi:pimeloyl-ACP methyl ester carboxylesterase
MTKINQNSAPSLHIPKAIRYTAKLFEAISPKLATRFAALLFTTPIKHKIPKREWQMLANSTKERLILHNLKKEIQMYSYGTGSRNILLIHGWSGRGTQMVKIADALVEKGFKIISFDAPAHGKSTGKRTLMPEFIQSILEIEKKYGPFEYAIGHSLGGMSLLTVLKQGFPIKKAIIIGSGDIIQDIIDDFVLKLDLKPNIGLMLKAYFETKSNESMENYASHFNADKISIPLLIIHDENDIDVPVKAAYHIDSYISQSELYITKGLGHRKILGDKKVIQKCLDYLN